jgi:SAM-dependent methyltransferase
MPSDLQSSFGSIDIYLFDQLLRGQIRPADRVVDVGCGHGRNLVYLFQAGYEVFAVDADPGAVGHVREVAARLAPHLLDDHFRVAPIEQNGFPDGLADVAISSAVLHFARDEAHFQAMLEGTWRLIRPGGLLFCRLASSIGIESLIRPVNAHARRYDLPDGTERFLVDQPFLLAWTRRLGGRLVDPIKTTVVQDQRSMTTWVVRRNAAC